MGRVVLVEVTKKVALFFNLTLPGWSNCWCTDWRCIRRLHLYPPRDIVSPLPLSFCFQVRSLDLMLKKSFQLIVWLLPSFTGGAISVSIVGILLGPMYPIAIKHAAHVLPRHLVNGTVGWMSAGGAAGSALLPFVTGTMASKLGIESLQPLCVFLDLPVSHKTFRFFLWFRLLVMMVLLGTIWSLVPKKPQNDRLSIWSWAGLDYFF